MIEGKRILAVVPARGGSKGIPLKNIQPVGGVPLVAKVAEVLRELPEIDCSVVSTDHPDIVKVARQAGLSVPFIRPEGLSGDWVSDTPVLIHALLEMEKIDNTRFDVVVMLQPTSPLRTSSHVLDSIHKLISGNFDAVWTVSETDSKYHPLKQFRIRGDLLDYYEEAGKQIIARQQLSTLYHKNGAAYAISRSCLVEHQSIKGERCSFLVIKEPMVNIDTPDDLRLADLRIRRSGL